jgi:serine protease
MPVCRRTWRPEKLRLAAVVADEGEEPPPAAAFPVPVLATRSRLLCALAATLLAALGAAAAGPAAPAHAAGTTSRAAGPAAPARAAGEASSSGVAAAAGAVSEHVVVRFADGTTAAQRARAARAAGARAPRHIVGDAWLLGPRRRGSRPDRAALARRADVISATPELQARIAVFDDTGVARHSGVPGGWQQLQWDLVGPAGIDVAPAWDAARAAGAPGGRHVKVAVVDTGLAYTNRGRYRRSPDLPAARILPGHDFVDGDDRPIDRNGHGTFVASTIAAAANNHYGMVGVAYRADIIPVRVLDARGGSGSARIARGIRFAVDRGAQVINASIELFREVSPFDVRAMSITAAPEIRQAIRYAHRHGVAVVAAAGNLGDRSVPSTRLGDSIIYVGGSTEHGCLGDYSNVGPGLDLVAPGGGRDAALPGDPRCAPNAAPGRNVFEVTFRRGQPSRFLVPGSYRGTSMAAPHVTGVVALMLGAGTLGRSPSPEAIERHLKATALDLGAPGPDRFYGAGLLDAGAALGVAR